MTTLFTVVRLREDGELTIYHFRNGVSEDAHGRWACDEPSQSLLSLDADDEALGRLQRRKSLQERTQELTEALHEAQQELDELDHAD